MNTRVGRLEVYLIVGFLGLAAFALGFAAEVTKVKEKSRDSYGTCIYSRSPAAPLAFVATFSTIIAVIIVTFVSVATRCDGFRRPTCNPNDDNFMPRTLGIFFLIYMGIAASVSMFKLLPAALINQKLANTSSECRIVKSMVFAAGGIWGLSSCASGLFSYYYLSKISQNDRVEPVITLGKPSYTP